MWGSTTCLQIHNMEKKMFFSWGDNPTNMFVVGYLVENKRLFFAISGFWNKVILSIILNPWIFYFSLEDEKIPKKHWNDNIGWKVAQIVYLLGIYCIIIFICNFLRFVNKVSTFHGWGVYPHGLALEFHFWVLNFQSTQEEYVILKNVLRFDSYDF